MKPILWTIIYLILVLESIIWLIDEWSWEVVCAATFFSNHMNAIITVIQQMVGVKNCKICNDRRRLHDKKEKRLPYQNTWQMTCKRRIGDKYLHQKKLNKWISIERNREFCSWNRKMNCWEAYTKQAHTTLTCISC